MSSKVVLSPAGSPLTPRIRRVQTMQWCRFQVEQHVSYGLVENDQVTEVTGSPFAEHTVTRTSYPLGQVKVLPPVSHRCSTPPHLTIAAMWKAWRGGAGQHHTIRPGLSRILARCMHSSAQRTTSSCQKSALAQS